MSTEIDLISDKDKKRLEKEKEINDRNEEDARNIMKSAAGRRFINWILEEASVHNGIYVPGDSGYGTTYNSGRQDLGLVIMRRILKSAPEAYLQMRNEFKSDRIQAEKEINKGE